MPTYTSKGQEKSNSSRYPAGRNIFEVLKMIEVHVEKYRRTRWWGVYMNGSLVAVVTYRKGAMNLKHVLEAMSATIDEKTARIAELLSLRQAA